MCMKGEGVRIFRRGGFSAETGSCLRATQKALAKAGFICCENPERDGLKEALWQNLDAETVWLSERHSARNLCPLEFVSV